MQVRADCVRGVIHALNKQAFGALELEGNGRSLRAITDPECEYIRLIARTSTGPEDHRVLARELRQAVRSSGQARRGAGGARSCAGPAPAL